MSQWDPSDAAAVAFSLDAAGNRGAAGYEIATGKDAALNLYTETPFNARTHDARGSLAGLDAGAYAYTYDAHNWLSGYIIGGSRTYSDFANLSGWTTLSGTWSAANGHLEETTSGQGRILRDVAGHERMTFRYKSGHDPADPDATPATDDFQPEYYALAILRAEQVSSEWSFLSVALSPTSMKLLEWVEDAPTELATADITSEQDQWYELEIRVGIDDIDVYRSIPGEPAELLLSVEHTTALTGASLGFGVGGAADFVFEDFRAFTGTDTADVLAESYRYDALGRRIAKTAGGATTWFVHDGDRVVEERTANGTLAADYVYGPAYVDEVLQMRRDTDANGALDATYYFHQDDLYNVVAVTDGTGAVAERYDYGAFGEPLFYEDDGTPLSASAIGNPLLFTGRWYDAETGFYYYRNRYLDPQTGRFLSRDPLGAWGDAMNLGNGQTYAGNNPWTRLDPYGEETMYGPGGKNRNIFARAWYYPREFLMGAIWTYPISSAWNASWSGTKEAYVGGDYIQSTRLDLNRFERNAAAGNRAQAPMLKAQMTTAVSETANALRTGVEVGAVVIPASRLVTVMEAGSAAVDIENGNFARAAIPGVVAGSLIGGEVVKRVVRSRAIQRRLDELALPLQRHHFATPTNKKYASQMEDFASEFGIDLHGDWNLGFLPHRGRHDERHHEFVLLNMLRAAEEAGGRQDRFLDLFDDYVREPILRNPLLLRKEGWE